MTAAPEGCCTLARRLSPEALASLDKALLEGTPYRKAREQAGLPPKDDSAVYKHRAHVLADAEASYEASGAAESQQSEAPGKQAEAATPAAAHLAAARPLIEEARRLRKRASKLLKRVEAGEIDVDFKAASSLVGQLKGVLELEAKLLGEIKAAATTVNVYNSPDWHRLRDLLVTALADHPDALAAVIDVLAAEQSAPALH